METDAGRELLDLVLLGTALTAACALPIALLLGLAAQFLGPRHRPRPSSAGRPEAPAHTEEETATDEPASGA